VHVSSFETAMPQLGLLSEDQHGRWEQALAVVD